MSTTPDKGSPVTDPRWYPWNSGGVEARTIQEAWRLANEWLYDFGIDLVGGRMPPDAMAYTDKVCVYAFRLDEHEAGGPSVIVTVEIDEDPPARAVRVEVHRA